MASRHTLTGSASILPQPPSQTQKRPCLRLSLSIPGAWQVDPTSTKSAFINIDLPTATKRQSPGPQHVPPSNWNGARTSPRQRPHTKHPGSSRAYSTFDLSSADPPLGFRYVAKFVHVDCDAHEATGTPWRPSSKLARFAQSYGSSTGFQIGDSRKTTGLPASWLAVTKNSHGSRPSMWRLHMLGKPLLCKRYDFPDHSEIYTQVGPPEVIPKSNELVSLTSALRKLPAADQSTADHFETPPAALCLLPASDVIRRLAQGLGHSCIAVSLWSRSRQEVWAASSPSIPGWRDLRDVGDVFGSLLYHALDLVKQDWLRRTTCPPDTVEQGQSLTSGATSILAQLGGGYACSSLEPTAELCSNARSEGGGIVQPPEGPA
ncbi:hypothetical protein NMY22_g10887 [Coprinellus aureogranulatus]|nr:hypothetical protein NMY22_g10887 [Coprinellus aureogranulatus]